MHTWTKEDLKSAYLTSHTQTSGSYTTRQHGVTSQKIVILIFTTMKTLDLTVLKLRTSVV
jgi:hypothetical protein